MIALTFALTLMLAPVSPEDAAALSGIDANIRHVDGELAKRERGKTVEGPSKAVAEFLQVRLQELRQELVESELQARLGHKLAKEKPVVAEIRSDLLKAEIALVERGYWDAKWRKEGAILTKTNAEQLAALQAEIDRLAKDLEAAFTAKDGTFVRSAKPTKPERVAGESQAYKDWTRRSESSPAVTGGSPVHAPTGGSVFVHGYYRSNGTYVNSYTRRK